MDERIVLESDESVDRWCRLLACSEMDLIRAVWTVGPRAEDVERFFWTIPLPDQAVERAGRAAISRVSAVCR